jgi:glycosyltransferase involved in cell wall biosynthesis
MARIIFINRFFFPDHSATSQILSDLAFYLAGRGHEVHVVTSRQRYDDPRACLPEIETVDGVVVHRLATTRFGRSALLGRGFDYASFYRAVWDAVLTLANPGDILVAKTDPPLVCIPAMRLARRRNLRLINWVKDLYPELATRLGVPFVRGPVARGLVYARDAALHAARANVVIGERMADALCARGIAAERIHLIPDWCDDEEIRPVAHCENPLRREWGLEDRFVVGYSGNLGKGHEFVTVAAAAERLREDDRILFLFIGGGQKFAALQRCVGERGLDHRFRFLPYQDRAVLPYSLGAADLHLISLNPELEGLILPCKFYGIAAAGRPIIPITATDGDIARLVRRHDCGVVIEPGDGEGLAEALQRLSRDSAGVAALGGRARHMLDRHFTRRQAFASWHDLIESVA